MTCYHPKFTFTSTMEQLKTLSLLLGKIFRRAKVTNFLFGDENFVRRIVSPNKVLPDKVLRNKNAKKTLVWTILSVSPCKSCYQIYTRQHYRDTVLSIDSRFTLWEAVEGFQRKESLKWTDWQVQYSNVLPATPGRLPRHGPDWHDKCYRNTSLNYQKVQDFGSRVRHLFIFN